MQNIVMQQSFKLSEQGKNVLNHSWNYHYVEIQCKRVAIKCVYLFIMIYNNDDNNLIYFHLHFYLDPLSLN